jgi:AcrR family transcriptional regulator
MGRPKEHDDSIRQALLLAAEDLVNNGGPAALSVRTVADEVGTTTRAVYSVFGSKDGLLEAMAIRLFELLSVAVNAVKLTDDPAADVITASLDGFRRVALDHPSLYNLVFLQVVPDLALGPEFTKVATDTFRQLETLVARVPGASKTTEAARMIHALTEGLAGMELRGVFGSPRKAEKMWRTSLTTLLHGLAD